MYVQLVWSWRIAYTRDTIVSVVNNEPSSLWLLRSLSLSRSFYSSLVETTTQIPTLESTLCVHCFPCFCVPTLFMAIPIIGCPKSFVVKGQEFKLGIFFISIFRFLLLFIYLFINLFKIVDVRHMSEWFFRENHFSSSNYSFETIHRILESSVVIFFDSGKFGLHNYLPTKAFSCSSWPRTWIVTMVRDFPSRNHQFDIILASFSHTWVSIFPSLILYCPNASVVHRLARAFRSPLSKIRTAMNNAPWIILDSLDAHTAPTGHLGRIGCRGLVGSNVNPENIPYGHRVTSLNSRFFPSYAIFQNISIRNFFSFISILTKFFVKFAVANFRGIVSNLISISFIFIFVFLLQFWVFYFVFPPILFSVNQEFLFLSLPDTCWYESFVTTLLQRCI